MVISGHSARLGFAVRHGGEIGPSETRSFFVRVEPDAQALNIELQRGAGRVRFLRFDLHGVGVDSDSSLNCYDPAVTPDGRCSGSPTSRTVADPGTRRLGDRDRGPTSSDAASAPYTPGRRRQWAESVAVGDFDGNGTPAWPPPMSTRETCRCC